MRAVVACDVILSPFRGALRGVSSILLHGVVGCTISSGKRVLERPLIPVYTVIYMARLAPMEDNERSFCNVQKLV